MPRHDGVRRDAYTFAGLLSLYVRSGIRDKDVESWYREVEQDAVRQSLKGGVDGAGREKDAADRGGYKQSVKKTFKVKQVEYDPTTGKKTAEREELKTGIDEVPVPADVRAGIYWLSNRAPERWGAHTSGSERVSEPGGVVILPELDELGDESDKEDEPHE